MAFDVGQIWVPRVKDTVGGLYAQRWVYNGSTSVTATTINSNPNDALANVPVDKVRFITYVGLALDPGATEIVTGLFWQVELAPGFTVYQRYDAPRDTITGGQRCAWQGVVDVIVFPGESVQALATIGTATNPKTLYWTFHGYDLPRGNVQ